MPDVISRIRLEATGADQAAREILKLRDAYTRVSQAARDLAPGAISGDPFQKATAAAGGGVIGGQRPEEVTERESRSRNYRNQVNEREQSNRNVNRELRQVPGAVGGVMGMAQQAGGGQFAGAVGQGLGSLGALLTGPVGVAALAAGAVFKGLEFFSGKEYERVRGFYGTGMGQRMEMPYEQLRETMLRAGRRGVPEEMIQQFLNAGSVAGMTGRVRGTEAAIATGLEVFTRTGVNAATLIGTLTKAGINPAMANMDLFAMMKGSFGQPNMTLFVNELTRMIQQAGERGITITEEEAKRQAHMIGAYAQFGGFTPEGAIAINQKMMERGRAVSQVRGAEDILAFQMMQRAMPGKSITDVMTEIEAAPEKVNRVMYEYLKSATGGDQELLRLRMQQFMGPGTDMSAAIKTINTLEEVIAGKKQLEKSTISGLPEDEKVRAFVAAKQMHLTEKIEAFSAEIVKDVGDIARRITSNEPLTVTIQDIKSPTEKRQEREAAEAEEKKGRAAFVREIEANPRLSQYLGGVYGGLGMAGGWRDVVSGKGKVSSWEDITEQLLAQAMLAAGSKVASTRGAPSAVKAFTELSELRATVEADRDVTFQEMLAALQEIVELMQIEGVVYTDGQGK